MLHVPAELISVLRREPDEFHVFGWHHRGAEAFAQRVQMIAELAHLFREEWLRDLGRALEVFGGAKGGGPFLVRGFLREGTAPVKQDDERVLSPAEEHASGRFVGEIAELGRPNTGHERVDDPHQDRFDVVFRRSGQGPDVVLERLPPGRLDHGRQSVKVGIERGQDTLRGWAVVVQFSEQQRVQMREEHLGNVFLKRHPGVELGRGTETREPGGRRTDAFLQRRRPLEDARVDGLHRGVDELTLLAAQLDQGRHHQFACLEAFDAVLGDRDDVVADLDDVAALAAQDVLVTVAFHRRERTDRLLPEEEVELVLQICREIPRLPHFVGDLSGEAGPSLRSDVPLSLAVAHAVTDGDAGAQKSCLRGVENGDEHRVRARRPRNDPFNSCCFGDQRRCTGVEREPEPHRSLALRHLATSFESFASRVPSS